MLFRSPDSELQADSGLILLLTHSSSAKTDICTHLPQILHSDAQQLHQDIQYHQLKYDTFNISECPFHGRADGYQKVLFMGPIHNAEMVTG